MHDACKTVLSRPIISPVCRGRHLEHLADIMRSSHCTEVCLFVCQFLCMSVLPASVAQERKALGSSNLVRSFHAVNLTRDITLRPTGQSSEGQLIDAM